MSSEVTGSAEGDVVAGPAAEPELQPGLESRPESRPGLKPGGAGGPVEDGQGSHAGARNGSGLGSDGGSDSGSDAGFDPGSDTAQWFLRTGRAGLLPDAMTESWEDEADPAAGTDGAERAETAGAPPWAGESDGPLTASPPPWESGPWPGPGQPRPARGGRASGAAPAGAAGSQAGTAGGRGGGWPAGLVLAAGIVPLVLPGLIVGVLSLRRAWQAGTSQLASWAAIVLSVAWAVVIVAVLSGGSSGQSACASYPASVRHAYSQAVTDLASPRISPAQAAGISQAASAANAAAAAAATGQSGVRTELAAMANDLEQAGTDVSAHRAVPRALIQHLAADGTALDHSCPS